MAPDLIASVDRSTEPRPPTAAAPVAKKATERINRPAAPEVSAPAPAPALMSAGASRNGGRLAGFFVAGTVLTVAIAGVVIATRGGSSSGDEDGGGSTTVPPTTMAETTTTTESEIVVPVTEASTTTALPTTTDAPPVSEVPPVTGAPTTTSAPISEEPVCGTGEGLLPADGEPVRVILDTGVGLGVDDLGAVAVLHALADAGEAEILAMMVSTGGDPAAGQTIDAVNTYYGRPDLPIGVVSGPAPSGTSPYTAEIAAGFPNDLVAAAPAVDVYRETLAAQPDGSVTIVSTGFLTNLAELIASPADAGSPSTGAELVGAKVSRWVAMGGAYPAAGEILGGPEFNFAMDTPAAQRSVADWPTPAVFTGFEVGSEIFTASALQAATPAENPVREGYRLWGATESALSFDLAAVLVAVRGTSDGAFEICTGSNTVGADGVNTWENQAGAQQGYVRTVASNGAIAADLDALLTAAPAN